MFLYASIDPTDLSGLGPEFSLGLLALALTGLAALTFVAVLVVADAMDSPGFQPDRFEFELGPVDRGTALPCWCNDDSLQNVAAQHQVDGALIKIEKRKSAGLRASVPGLGKGRVGGSTAVTEKPYDDQGRLILRLLGRLDEEGELNQTADRALVSSLQVTPIVAFSEGPERVKAFFRDWLDKQFQDGLRDVSSDVLAAKLAEMDDEIAEEHLREHLEEAHRSLANSDGSILLLEGEWRVEGNDGDLLLERTDLRVAAYDDPVPRSVPIPTGISIRMHLDGELTRHGKNAMVGVTRPVRACVMGTVRQHDPRTGCLEITPIAVFQRMSSS